jgi:hypothetical protein
LPFWKRFDLASPMTLGPFSMEGRSLVSATDDLGADDWKLHPRSVRHIVPQIWQSIEAEHRKEVDSRISQTMKRFLVLCIAAMLQRWASCSEARLGNLRAIRNLDETCTLCRDGSVPKNPTKGVVIQFKEYYKLGTFPLLVSPIAYYLYL